MTVRVRLVDEALGVHDPSKGDFHARIVPVLAAHGIDTLVPNGAEIDVPDEVAGTEPKGWVTVQDDDIKRLIALNPHALFHRYDPNQGLQVHDAGSGLLAQSIWERVTGE